MSIDKRKDDRKALRYPAQIDTGDGSPPKQCIISNVSASGARVSINNADDLPDSLDLLFAPGHGARRRCVVVWRGRNALGLEFSKKAVANTSKPGNGVFKTQIQHD